MDDVAALYVENEVVSLNRDELRRLADCIDFAATSEDFLALDRVATVIREFLEEV